MAKVKKQVLVRGKTKTFYREQLVGTDKIEEPKKKKKVKNEEKPKKEKKPREPKWYDDLSAKWGLRRNLPPDKISPDDPKLTVIDAPPDKTREWIIRWHNGKKFQYCYPREVEERHQKEKYARVLNITPEQIEDVKSKCIEWLNNGKATEKQKEKAAIVLMIAETGLRPGYEANYFASGNRGISTLSPPNIKFKNGQIALNFIGKSKKENNTIIENNPILFKYLKRKVKEAKELGNILIFSTNAIEAKDFLNDKKNGLGLKIKLKDLRTYVACDLARKILIHEEIPAKPTMTWLKKTIKKVSLEVSEKLNNTPEMARSSYIAPQIINEFAKSCGFDVETLMRNKIIKGIKSNKLSTMSKKSSFADLTLNEIFRRNRSSYSIISNPGDYEEGDTREEIDYFDLPDYLIDDKEKSTRRTRQRDNMISKAKKIDNLKQLEMGRKVEAEHAPTYKFIKDFLDATGEMLSEKLFYESIAKDHLMEIPDYYTRLEEMEKKAGVEN